MSVPIVVLSEDAARDAEQVVQHLVRSALQCAVAGLRTHELVFEPAPPPLASMARGRAWASSRHRDQVSFIQGLASQLGRGHVVVLHYDADVPWGLPSPHDEQFEERVSSRVARLARTTDRLVAMVPHTAIESWAYRSTSAAIDLCRRLGLDEAPHARWAAAPAELEAIVGIKRVSALADRQNLTLVATGWPRRDAQADGRSFARFVTRLEAVPGLLASLR